MGRNFVGMMMVRMTRGQAHECVGLQSFILSLAEPNASIELLATENRDPIGIHTLDVCVIFKHFYPKPSWVEDVPSYSQRQ